MIEPPSEAPGFGARGATLSGSLVGGGFRTTRWRRSTKPGKAQRMTHDDKRNGTTSLYAALEIATGEVTGACYPQHTHQ